MSRKAPSLGNQHGRMAYFAIVYFIIFLQNIIATTDILLNERMDE